MVHEPTIPMRAPCPVWHKVVRHRIDQVVENPRVRDLLREWDRLRGPRRRAPLSMFHGGFWPEMLDRMLLLRREPDGDYLHGHCGAQIARLSMTDLSGRRVSEAGGATASFLVACYDEALARDAALYTVHFSEPSRAVFTWERLVLPLHDEHGGDWLLVYCEPLEMRHELFEAVVNATSDALLALRRVNDPQERDLGWLVLVVNPRLCELFDLGADRVAGRLVADAMPDWGLLNVETECLLTLRSGSGRSLTRVHPAADGRLRYLNIQIAPLTDGVVLSLSDTTDLHEAQNRLRHLATTDALTGLANRREFDEHLRLEAQRARRSGDPLTLVMADIDAFKAYNDHCGHAAGDDCLRQFALLLRQAFGRQLDLVARYGGEEFAVLLPATRTDDAVALVERLLLQMERLALPHPASPVAGHVTASFGVASFDRPRDDDELSLLRRADGALYLAKQGGRNRVCTGD